MKRLACGTGSFARSDTIFFISNRRKRIKSDELCYKRERRTGCSLGTERSYNSNALLTHNFTDGSFRSLFISSSHPELAGSGYGRNFVGSQYLPARPTKPISRQRPCGQRPCRGLEN